MALSSAITLHSVSFSWPDGTEALSEINGSFSRGKTGLVGDNGAGKSTLLRLIAGELTPTSGRVELNGEVAYLPQMLLLTPGMSVAGLLGIAPILRALRAVEAGSLDPADYDTVGERWDIEARTEAELSRIGLGVSDLDRLAATLSGGQAMLVAIIGLRLAQASITLLDEPSNNLDRPTRTKLYSLLDDWPGTLVVISHDLALLERMEHTAELFGGNLTNFGGTYSEYLQYLDREQDAAKQAARTAEQQLKQEKRQRSETETKLARRQQAGRKLQLSGSIPRMAADNLRKKSQASAGVMRAEMESKVASAQQHAQDAGNRIRKVEQISIDLPDPRLPRSRKIAVLSDENSAHIIQGPERVGLVGANGVGKTSLLNQLLGLPGGTALPIKTQLFCEAGFLPQRLDTLPEQSSAMDSVRAVAPLSTSHQVRNALARMLLRGDSVDRPLATLSGGERFRVYLATLLLADPPTPLIVLDEPTNNLDISSVEQLSRALNAYRGALLMVSHDEKFLSSIGLDYLLELDHRGSLKKLDPT